ncbi:allophanate hydrolase subunit 1 [Amycolatopsis sp.]|uniref:5-oxoprolinase subunit B family protein n=1 Tax=Amycolatopsis sp. TaxID=37632 RepID=UPI002D023A6B|nr:allophanate hydrolase subunit 1 [Amycolatopsis sp.]HVV09937.1 allophanate hydrolase subunit 1 [Amycolatopsis sp.]
MRVRPFGDQALLAEVDGIDAVLGLYAALAESLPAGITEMVPAATTLLVRFDPRVTDPETLAARLAGIEPVPAQSLRGGEVVVPVIYDGPDLGEVGDSTGLGVAGVIAAHTATQYIVAFGGFAPGFGYLTGLDPRLHLPRRSVPRTKVPVGSVAIAGEYTGVYPRSSPGGWQLLGRTEIPLWDTERRPPALLAPGTKVRFEAVAA